MKVGFIAPLSIVAVNGGVRTQAHQTAKNLKNQGVEVDFISPWQDSLDVDLVHIFTASPETLGIIKRCSEIGIKTVLSPVFFSTRPAKDISLKLKLERTASKLGSGISSEYGIKAQICNLADKVVPNTQEEADLIIQAFDVSAKKVHVVPNGVEERFKDSSPDLFIKEYGLKEFVLFAGHAGAQRKNVIKLLERAKDIPEPVVIIGSFYDDDYGASCKKLAQTSNVTLIETQEHDSELLASAYAACNTFILPSLFETPGIAAMEAALAKANIVITRYGGTKEYFGDLAEYIDPQSSESIVKGINKSLTKPESSNLRDHILQHYTWSRVAELTAEVYNTVSKF
ncbi:MAG: glycosyltransferase [Balneola sp.]|nr:MAG: glycosyltransferase [Balneola sp.]